MNKQKKRKESGASQNIFIASTDAQKEKKAVRMLTIS